MRRILIALLLIAVSSIAFSYDDLILVEKGAFMMGDIWGVGASDEKPTHKVIFDYDFYIGKYEVTLSEYSLFLEAKGQTRASETVAPEMKELPVTNVTWWDAIAYCN